MVEVGRYFHSYGGPHSYVGGSRGGCRSKYLGGICIFWV